MTLDEKLVKALQEDYEHAPSARPTGPCSTTWASSRATPPASAPTTTRGCAHGFDDRAILQITLIASWFNYINRVADALGVGREP